MAQPRRVATTPAKKLTRKHGPKRKMFHCWNKTMRLTFGRDGLLTKYNNKESFAQACAKRGVRTDISYLWSEFMSCPNNTSKDEYLKNIVAHNTECMKKQREKEKNSLTKAKK